MRRFLILLVLAFAPVLAFSQAIVKGAGTIYTNGAPSHSVNQNQDSEMAWDTTGQEYLYSRDGLGWILAGFRVQKFAFSIAPTAAPQDKQSEILLNDVDSLYRWRAGAWWHLNKGGAGNTDLTFTGSGPYTLNSSTGTDVTMTQGSGIVMTRTSNDLAFAASDISATNELQTFASTSDATSHTLTLSNSGGSLQYIEGTGISLTTGGTGLDGTVTIASTLTGESTDARNGLSMSGFFVELGGTGLQNTSIAWAAFSFTNTFNTLAGGSGMVVSSNSTAATGNTQKLAQIALSGANATASQATKALEVSNSHTGTSPTNYAVYATISGSNTLGVAVTGEVSGSGSGVSGSASSGSGVIGSSTSGIGGQFSSSTGNSITGTTSINTAAAANFTNTHSATNAIIEVVKAQTATSGTAAAGLGVKIGQWIEASTGTQRVASSWFSDWTVATEGSQASRTGITTVNSGTENTRFEIAADGQIKFNAYGGAGFVGTPAKALLVEAGGNVVQGPISDLTGTGVANRFTLWSGTNTLTSDAAWTFDAVNDRATFAGTVSGLGPNNAILNLNSGAIAASTAFLMASGNITNELVVEYRNANNAAATAGVLQVLTVGGSVAGDPKIQFGVIGAVTHVFGLDNSDADKMKLTMNAANPGDNGNDGFVWTNNTPPRYGINISAPLHPLDVSGVARATQWRMAGNLWDNTMIAFGTGAGTGPTVNSISGGNNGFQINFTTGTTPTADAIIFTATYPNSYGSLTYPVMWGRGNPGGLNWLGEMAKFNIDSAGAANFVLKAKGTLTASTQYAISFVIMGY